MNDEKLTEVSRDVKFIEDKCWSDPSDIQHGERSHQPDLPIKLPILEVQQQEEETESPPQHQKTRSLRELYEQTPVLEEQLQYALFSCHTTSFNEAVKDEQ